MASEKEILELSIAFAKYIPLLAGTAGIKNTRLLTARVVKLDAEDEKNRVCSVESILDNETITYDNVNLSMEQNDGLIEIPAIDSTVLVACMPDGELYIFECSDIDKLICVIDGSNKFVFDATAFVFNGGTFGGMAKTAVLATKFNNAENRINLIATDLLAIATAAAATSSIPVTGTTLAGFINSAISNILVPLTLTTQTEIEDTKITH